MKRVLSVLFSAFVFFSLSAATFTVNTLDNTDDGTCDTGHCSLREAINAANGNAGPDLIDFSVTGTIDLSGAALPVIMDQLEISGAGIVLANSPVHGLDFNTGSANSVVSGISITGSSVHGIFGDNSSNMMITNCDLSLNGTIGTPIGASFGNGISLVNCTGVLIEGCTVNSNRENGIYVENASNSNFQNNTINGSGFHGFIMVGGDNASITNNTSNGNGVAAPTAGGFDSSSGIILVNTSSVTISGNTCNSSLLESGIFLASSNSCTVTNNNTAMNFHSGIRIEGSSDNTFTGNFSSNNMGSGTAPGFFIDSNGSNNVIQNNTISGNECAGVQIDSGNGNQVIENIMFDNACVGIQLNGGNNNFPAPVICLITNTQISGTVTEASTLHFYVADQDDPCQGNSLIGSLSVGAR
jgi:CSLREA domain-containing protein